MESFEASGGAQMPGVHVSRWETMGVQLTEVVIEDDGAARALHKAVGCYMTLECPAVRQRDLDARLALSNLLGEEIARMYHRQSDAPVLVVGLGNRRITPDSLGPQTVDRTLVTRHIFTGLAKYADPRMHSVCALAPGVLGVTGVETMEMVEALCKFVRPQAVICIDSLAARASSRIGAAIQLTDTGIQPGSGVGNHRRALTKESLGVDVVAVGVPTVIYAATLARDAFALLSGEGEGEAALGAMERELMETRLGNLIVTPRDIDAIVQNCAALIAGGLNRALHPGLSDEQIAQMMD